MHSRKVELKEKEEEGKQEEEVEVLGQGRLGNQAVWVKRLVLLLSRGSGLVI